MAIGARDQAIEPLRQIDGNVSIQRLGRNRYLEIMTTSDNTSEKLHADEALSASAGPQHGNKFGYVAEIMEREGEPTLSAFFGNNKSPFGAFVRPVRKQKVSDHSKR